MAGSIYKTIHFSLKFITQLFSFTLPRFIRVFNQIESYCGQSRLSMIVRMNVVLNRTVLVDRLNSWGGGGGRFQIRSCGKLHRILSQNIRCSQSIEIGQLIHQSIKISKSELIDIDSIDQSVKSMTNSFLSSVYFEKIPHQFISSLNNEN